MDWVVLGCINLTDTKSSGLGKVGVFHTVYYSSGNVSMFHATVLDWRGSRCSLPWNAQQSLQSLASNGAYEIRCRM